MQVFGRGRDGDAVLRGVDLDLASGERRLAACVDVATGDVLAASTFHLTIVPAGGGPAVQRPWHLVETGSYDNEADVLSVSWVDRQPTLALQVGGDRGFLEAFRERVQASVVIAESLELEGGRTVRLVVRKDLERDRLLDQVILGRGVRIGDPGVRSRIEMTRRALREQVGLS